MFETRALAGISVLSFYLGIFEVSMGAFQVSNGRFSHPSLIQAIRYIVHSLAYLVVIVAINFNVALLGVSGQRFQYHSYCRRWSKKWDCLERLLKRIKNAKVTRKCISMIIEHYHL